MNEEVWQLETMLNDQYQLKDAIRRAMENKVGIRKLHMGGDGCVTYEKVSIH